MLFFKSLFLFFLLLSPLCASRIPRREMFFKPLFLFFLLLSPLCASRIPRREMFFKPLFLFFLLLSPLCASIDTITLNQQLKDGDSIVSKDRKFELGFFGPDNSSSYSIFSLSLPWICPFVLHQLGLVYGYIFRLHYLPPVRYTTRLRGRDLGFKLTCESPNKLLLSKITPSCPF